MKPYRKQKGFDLIALLIVVAIIGVLAAMGYGFYYGKHNFEIRYDARNDAQSQHNRIRDFIAASFQKCADGSVFITLETKPAGTINYRCSMPASEFAQPMVTHFNWVGLDGFGNPWENFSGDCCYQNSSTTPPLGQTYIYSVNNGLRITTNIGTTGEDNDYLMGTVTKE